MTMRFGVFTEFETREGQSQPDALVLSTGAKA